MVCDFVFTTFIDVGSAARNIINKHPRYGNYSKVQIFYSEFVFDTFP